MITQGCDSRCIMNEKARDGIHTYRVMHELQVFVSAIPSGELAHVSQAQRRKILTELYREPLKRRSESLHAKRPAAIPSLLQTHNTRLKMVQKALM